MGMNTHDLYAQEQRIKKSREDFRKTLDEIASEFGRQIGDKMQVFTEFTGSPCHPYKINPKSSRYKSYATIDQRFFVENPYKINFYAKNKFIMNIAEKHLSKFSKNYEEIEVNLYKCFEGELE